MGYTPTYVWHKTGKGVIVNRLIAGLALCIFCSCTLAEEGLTLEQAQQLEHLNDAINKLEVLSATFDGLSKKRRSDCIQAFGHKSFCQCLGDNLPVAWSFQEYIAIATQTKDENGYVNLDDELKSAYDKAITVRDDCVSSMTSN